MVRANHCVLWKRGVRIQFTTETHTTAISGHPHVYFVMHILLFCFYDQQSNIESQACTLRFAFVRLQLLVKQGSSTQQSWKALDGSSKHNGELLIDNSKPAM